jgi:hypothetical protein
MLTISYASICSCPSTDVPSFVEKYPKIKYAISESAPLLPVVIDL